jgi:hypothetical protein
VDGNLTINNLETNSVRNLICGTGVKGSLRLNKDEAPVVIGSTAAPCAGNTIGGSLQIGDNVAAVKVFDNAVAGNLRCTGNSSIKGSGDTAASLEGQCAAF